MNAIDLIAKKRDGGELSGEEIRFFVAGVVQGSIADYQAAAWLMAVYLRGMNRRETLDLTLAMRDSGDRIDLSDLPNGPCLDKHSTGGVGDKTTLVVVPILAAAGVPMLKMSGRGLGFSGGTVDKLEAIPGFRTDLSIAEAKMQVARIGAALIAQTDTLAPADKILYALRDVTATVECLPLIAGSILSKKLAAGAQRILLDVKVGQGAFMKTRAQAEALAHEMVAIGNSAGVSTMALLTAMEEPLGRAVGNGLEVREALEALLSPQEAERGLMQLCHDLAAHGLLAVGKAEKEAAAHTRVSEQFFSGKAAAKFAEIIAAQGGPSTCEAILAALPVAPIQILVLAQASGVVASLNAETVGRLAMAMGAGRTQKSDAIDPAVGIVLHCKTGQYVTPETRLATLHLRDSDKARTEAFAEGLRAAYRIVPEAEAPAASVSLLLATVT